MNESKELPNNEGEIAYIKELKSKLDVIDEDFLIHERVAEFVNELKTRYPDYPEYALYHAVSGSTQKEQCGKHDFPGGDSILKFMESLKVEYLP